MNEAPQNNGLPRGPLIVVAIGLLACVAAALLATDKTSGAAADLEWVQHQPLPDSKTASVPGGGGEMRLDESGIRVTGTNVSGYELYRVAAVLKITAGSPVGGGRIHCSMKAPGKTEVAQTSGSRASYPRSSEELYKQELPENVVVEFSSHGTYAALVELGDAFKHDRFTNERGIKLEWPNYRIGVEGWNFFLPPRPPSKPLEIDFASFWKTTGFPATKVACTLTTSAGTATVHTQGAITEHTGPIAE
jgi:hypothetical protein